MSAGIVNAATMPIIANVTSTSARVKPLKVWDLPPRYIMDIPLWHIVDSFIGYKVYYTRFIC